MPYKIGNLPSPKATQAEIADFLEVSCLLSEEGSFSIVKAALDNGIVEDEDAVDTPEIDEYDGYSDALSQIDERQNLIGDKYPFKGERLSLCDNVDCPKFYRTVYTFLLLATRWDMSSKRIVNGKDGALLFERLCNEILINYFGHSSKSMVFGTGAENGVKGFKEKVNEMLNEFSEKGYQFKMPEDVRNNQKDAGVDLVAFIPFKDSRKGHFVAFGQCKTGTCWRDKIGQMCPPAFCSLYLSPPLRFTPICIYMVSEACDKDWEVLAAKASGILFDRTRVMQFLPDKIEANLFNDIAIWTNGVVELMRKM